MDFLNALIIFGIFVVYTGLLTKLPPQRVGYPIKNVQVSQSELSWISAALGSVAASFAILTMSPLSFSLWELVGLSFMHSHLIYPYLGGYVTDILFWRKSPIERTKGASKHHMWVYVKVTFYLISTLILLRAFLDQEIIQPDDLFDLVFAGVVTGLFISAFIVVSLFHAACFEYGPDEIDSTSHKATLSQIFYKRMEVLICLTHFIVYLIGIPYLSKVGVL